MHPQCVRRLLSFSTVTRPRIELQQPYSIKSQSPSCLYFNPAVPHNLDWILLEQQLQDILFCISCEEIEMESQANFFFLPSVCVWQCEPRITCWDTHTAIITNFSVSVETLWQHISYNSSEKADVNWKSIYYSPCRHKCFWPTLSGFLAAYMCALR